MLLIKGHCATNDGDDVDDDNSSVFLSTNKFFFARGERAGDNHLKFVRVIGESLTIREGVEWREKIF